MAKTEKDFCDKVQCFVCEKVMDLDGDFEFNPDGDIICCDCDESQWGEGKEVIFDSSLSKILDASDEHVRVIRRSDGAIVLGALSKEGMLEMAACMMAGTYTEEGKFTVMESRWFDKNECWMVVLHQLNDE